MIIVVAKYLLFLWCYQLDSWWRLMLATCVQQLSFNKLNTVV